MPFLSKEKGEKKIIFPRAFLISWGTREITRISGPLCFISGPTPRKGAAARLTNTSNRCLTVALAHRGNTRNARASQNGGTTKHRTAMCEASFKLSRQTLHTRAPVHDVVSAVLCPWELFFPFLRKLLHARIHTSWSFVFPFGRRRRISRRQERLAWRKLDSPEIIERAELSWADCELCLAVLPVGRKEIRDP